MNYRATKVRLTCDERTVREWTSYMLDHLDEVSLALRNEGVRHEMWFMGRDSSLFVIGVMDVDDIAASRAAAAKSELSVDEVHKRFKLLGMQEALRPYALIGPARPFSKSASCFLRPAPNSPIHPLRKSAA
jgi:hypothetical protein